MIPAGFEQVHAVQVTQGCGHITFFKPHRDNEDLIVSQQFRLFERDLEFLMPITRLLIESARKADDDHVAFEDRLADLTLPVLTGLEILCIQPGTHTILDESAIEFVHGCLVTVGMNQKHVIRLC